LFVTQQLTAVDAFCGSGGLSLGIKRAGFELVAAFDKDEPSVRTHNKNMPGHAFVADANEVTGDIVRERGGLPAEADLDLLAGGPPCQGFSKQKRGAHLGDKRNTLVLEFLRLVEEMQPRAFLMENVATLAGVRGAHLVERFNSLSRYDLTGHFYLAANYGVPQTRQRFVLVGVRDDVPGGFEIPEATTPSWPTVGSVLDGLPEPPSDYSVHPDFPNHQAARVTAANIERFSYVPQGGGWQDIPFEKRLRCHQVVDVKSGGWPDVYGRLRWDGQCPTITGGFDSFTRGRYGHPLHDRPLTPREAARIQGYPDDYVFEGTRHDVRHQIGNAVPVPMAEAIAGSIATALTGATPRRPRAAQELTLFP
jgi:DNA (cytosine-5)-methyltransferase 1